MICERASIVEAELTYTRGGWKPTSRRRARASARSWPTRAPSHAAPRRRSIQAHERLGPLLETFVLQELRRQVSWYPDPVDFFHYRTVTDFEVDIVLERGSVAVAGVEVKAAASVTDADFRGLRKLRDAAGRQFAGGVVLYDGASAVRFGDTLFAVPMRVLWEN
ncbi:MAG TPA: DUF4143 domain-containing protein [Vicinamibacterales bacterium]|nr:DUF4143 domain-containing protein [Vicinamibacterales bacterium]